MGYDSRFIDSVVGDVFYIDEYGLWIDRGLDNADQCILDIVELSDFSRWIQKELDKPISV